MEKKNTTIEAFEDLAKMSTDLLKQIAGNAEKSDLTEMNKTWMMKFVNSDEGLEYIFEKDILSFIGIREGSVRVSNQTLALSLIPKANSKYRIHLPGKENHYEVPKADTFKAALEKVAELAADLGLQIVGVK